MCSMTTTWLVRCGDGARDIDEAVSRGIITVDFPEATDVTGLPVEEIAVQLATTKTRTAISRLAEMLYAFANEIDEGDAIISSDRARRQVVVGRVAGPYEWVEGDDRRAQHHTRKVDLERAVGLGRPSRDGQEHRAALSAQGAALPGSGDGAQPHRGGRGIGHARGLLAAAAQDRRTRSIDLRLEGASRNERLCTLVLHHPAAVTSSARTPNLPRLRIASKSGAASAVVADARPSSL